MKCEYWEAPDGTEGSFAPAESYVTCPYLKVSVDDILMVKQFEIEGSTWEDCMTKYHERMGFEPYRPMKEGIE